MNEFEAPEGFILIPEYPSQEMLANVMRAICTDQSPAFLHDIFKIYQAIIAEATK